MSAHWPVTNAASFDRPQAGVLLRRVSLGLLFSATARRHPGRIAFMDPADKTAWSGRPKITWTYGAAAEIVNRLAGGLRRWRLPAASRVGVCLPGGVESALALLAIEAAGHIPCLLPIAWDEDRLVTAAQRAGLAAILTQSRVGSVMLADRVCHVAARYFGLRYLGTFGPDVPDGVVNLDELALDGAYGSPTTADAQASAFASPGIVSFAGGDPDRPIYRAGDSLVAAAAAHLVAVRAAPSERILTLLPPHDLRGLVTGLAATLISGASLESFPVFDGAAFATALARPEPTHLVAPAFLERNLSGRAPAADLRSTTIVHRAPTRFAARDRNGTGLKPAWGAVIDTIAFDETALVSGRRGSGSDIALLLGRPDRLALPSGLMSMRREDDGRIAFRGQACGTQLLQRANPEPAEADQWQVTPYAPALYAGLAIAVNEATDALTEKSL